MTTSSPAAAPTKVARTENLEMSVITEPLDAVMAALINKIDRESPRRLGAILGAREILLLTAKTADVTSRSIRYLCAEKPHDPFRIPEYCLSVPPLNRTILDSLFTLIFVLEDPAQRCTWYHKAAWREQAIELKRYCAEYGHLPAWQEWLARLTAITNQGISLFGISASEQADPKAIPRWPSPGQMPNYQLKQNAPRPATRDFMSYLNDWFYADLSQQTHLSGAGLMKRASSLLHERNHPERERALHKNKYSWLGQTITLMLALASELETYLQFGLDTRLRYVWGLTTPVSAIAEEVYEKRYAALLCPSG